MTTLWICDGGFSTEEIERGVAAAQRVFSEAGVPAEAAWDAALKQADGLSHDDKAVIAWYEAEAAAILAAGLGWSSSPVGATLVLE